MFVRAFGIGSAVVRGREMIDRMAMKAMMMTLMACMVIGCGGVWVGFCGVCLVADCWWNWEALLIKYDMGEGSKLLIYLRGGCRKAKALNDVLKIMQ
jgi:hypothetical protein